MWSSMDSNGDFADAQGLLLVWIAACVYAKLLPTAASCEEPMPQSALCSEPLLAPEKRKSYEERIREICGYAREDGDRMCTESHRDFWDFVNASPEIRQASLVLCAEGTIRASWWNADGLRFGLEFLGSGLVEYVVVRKSLPAGQISTEGGEETLDKMRQRIRTPEISALLHQ